MAPEENAQEEASEETDPIANLEYIKKRVAEERDKEERKLQTFGSIEAEIDDSLDAYRLMKSVGISFDENQWPGVVSYPQVWRRQFDTDFPPAYDPAEMLRTHQLYSTTAGSAAYWVITGSHSQFETPDAFTHYEQIVRNFERHRELEDRTNEVIRRLAWLSEEAAGKFKAAWEALHAGIPFTDPASGAAFAMRSALDLTIKATLLERTPKPHPETKSDYLKHIAYHAAYSPEAKELLISQAKIYRELTEKLSKVKGTTELDRRVLRTLFFRAQDLLYIVVEAIDPTRLLPK